jgi:glycosyltransferase involved in cell wall biosynthesis
MRVAQLSHNARAGDAIGNTVAEKLAFFLDRGADVRVFVECGERLHPAVRPFCHPLAHTDRHGARDFLTAADLVVVEYGHYYRLLEWLPLCGGGKARVLFDYHGVTPPEVWPGHNREGIEAGARQRGLVWCADAAVAHSRFTCHELESATGYPRDRLFCLGHPVDREFFCPGSPSQTLADFLGLNDVFLLLFVGRLAPNKRLPVLVEALARLGDLGRPVHAALIGDDSDVYQEEARHCRERAAELGVADRLHLLGQVDEQRLRDAYRSADVLVIPSRHEGFCIPVVEALASGLPVVAARAAALPETVGSAGLTFVPDDPDDLARQVRRVLQHDRETRRPNPHGAQPLGLAEGLKADISPFQPRVAVVSFRYGTDFVGGAETSLRTIAESLHQAGEHVEVFTTCTREENAWSNQLPEGTALLGGIPVHRFRLDAHDRSRHLESVRAVLQAEGEVSAEVEREYLEHSLHSSRLIAALHARRDEFDAVIVGPYLFGLTLDVARELPRKTLLLPCFHDEPFARLRAWTQQYGWVGGILYHSPEEQAFAEAQLGLNHPGAVCCGALVAATGGGDPAAGHAHANSPGPYVVYCGRYSAQKGLPQLLDYAERYNALFPDRLTWVFLGQGEVAVPKHPAFRDLGFVPEAVKRDVLAGAAALVQLSRNESLSYAALEAWGQGTPVLADARCEVLAGHLCRCGAGRAVASPEEFTAALNDLCDRPDEWRELGRRGQEYVRRRYGSREELTRKVLEAVAGLSVPLAARLRDQGLRRAAHFDRARWREQFGELVEHLLDAAPRPYLEQVDVEPRSGSRTVSSGAGTVLVPVRVINRGTHAALSEGPGRFVLRHRLADEAGNPHGGPGPDTPLPGLLVPGRALAAAVPVAVPSTPGNYRVILWAERAEPDQPPDGRTATRRPERLTPAAPESWLPLTVAANGDAPGRGCCAPLLDAAAAALVEADRLRRLPDDYTDVTQGLLASWKRRIKRKLLGNFKHAYVDVLSRQQSAFNRALLTAVQELAECCATLEHAVRLGQHVDPQSALVHELSQQLAESRACCAALEERLARLEEGIPRGVDPEPGRR